MIADPPESDVLSELLRTVRLTGSVFLNGVFTRPFAIISPAVWDPSSALSRLRHVSVFHVIAEGECMFETPSGDVHHLIAGDVVLLPFTPEHRFWNGTQEGFIDADELITPGPIPGVGVLTYGGGGPATRFVCGYLESAELLPAPLFRTLPEVIIERTKGESGPVAATVAAVLSTVDSAPGAGAQVILGRLMEVLFVEVVRRHASRLPPENGGILAACRDPAVSRALGCLHAEPARHWTVDELAARAGASRSVLGEKFNKLVGAAPIEYLARLRMQLAAERLRSTRTTLAQVAADVGYESEAAFSRAFRRIVGVSPGAWREAQAQA